MEEVVKLEVGDYVLTQRYDGFPLIGKVIRVNKKFYTVDLLNGGEVRVSFALKEYGWGSNLYVPLGKTVSEDVINDLYKAVRAEETVKKMSRLVSVLTEVKTTLNKLDEIPDLQDILDKYGPDPEDDDCYPDDDDDWICPDYEAEERGDNDPACWDGDSLEAQETDEWMGFIND